MIPIAKPILNGNEKKYLEECIDTAWISSEGPFVKRFEDTFASFIGVKYGIAVSSGTAALETALFALGVGKDDEVIMPSFTIISCAFACLRLGAKPVLVDIESKSWTMDVKQIRKKITSKTKVIMSVHIYGHSVNMDEVLLLAKQHNLKVLEDIAEVQGAQYYSKSAGGKWLKCGSMGDISAVSFYANKIITTGEGGMVITDNEEYAEKACSYRNLCFRDDKRFYHTELGYNFRMTNLQAAVGLAQTEQIGRFIKVKEKIANCYRKELSGIKNLRFMSSQPYTKPIYWVYAVELSPEAGLDAEELMSKLKKQGIATRPFFRGLHSQPALNGLGLFLKEKYPRTDHAYRYGFYLPSSPTLSKKEINKIAQAIKRELK